MFVWCGSQLSISPQLLGCSITSPISRRRWGVGGTLVGIARERPPRSTILTDKSPRARQQSSTCGNDAVHMRREAASSVNDDISGTAPIKWNDVATAARVQSTELGGHESGFVFFSLSHTLRLGVCTYPHVRQKVILSSMFGCR